MAFDGVVIANIVYDMNRLLTGGRIYKIYQPEADELLLVVKNNKETYRLLISAGASLPLIYFTTKTKANPMTAPNFCMLLRKYISNGRIIEITQPGMERIVEITIEHLNELGDTCRKKMVVEIMGKHSNIIFIDEKNMIIDSIKHISNQVSSVREVLPGRTYIAPPGKGKISLNDLSVEWMENTLLVKPVSVQKAVYGSISGISPVLANEICYRADIDGDAAVASLTPVQQSSLYGELVRLKNQIETHAFSPNIIYEGKAPKEFGAFTFSMFNDLTTEEYPSISEVLETFYAQKEVVTRIRQKSVDLRHIVQNALERTAKKYDLQLKQLKDTDKKEKYKIYGELLHTYGYEAAPHQKELKCINYYDGKEITIPLDPDLNAMENAKKYFDRYGKLKRTYGENTGVLELSHVYDPLVIRIAACLAIIISFIPKVSAIISTMPSAIIGGVSFMLYGMISAIGVRNVVENKVDLTKSRNLIITGVIFVCGLGFGDGLTFTVAGTSITLTALSIAAIAGILLNIILPGNDYEFDEKADLEN